MRTHHLRAASLAVVLFGVTTLSSSPGWATGLDFLKKDQSVCYGLVAEGEFIPGVVLRLNVKKHSPLTTFKEKKQFDHPLQTTYSAMGKAIDAEFITPPSLGGVNGTVTVAKKTGARMVLSWSNQLTPWVNGLFTATVECSSAEASPTPQVWAPCTSQFIFNNFFDPQILSLSTLTWRQIDPKEHEACSEFPDPPAANGITSTEGDTPSPFNFSPAE